MRTNIDIDDELMREAMEATGAATKKAAVETSLRKLVALKLHVKDVAEHFRLQQIARRKAEREGWLEKWSADLKKNGNYPEFRTEIEE
jgi:Arc/MetJ family transcription regulator